MALTKRQQHAGPLREAARAAGRRHYETGWPCKNGHIAPRLVSTTNCTVCLAVDGKTRKSRPGYHSERYAAARERICENKRKRYAADPTREIQTVRDWQRRNPAAVRECNARRRAIERKATPKWYVYADCLKIHEEALQLRREGLDVHVDHIVPLKNPLVCGLHWAGNLQIETATDNLRKGNRRWPDMP
jgi:hypothetical protein